MSTLTHSRQHIGIASLYILSFSILFWLTFGHSRRRLPTRPMRTLQWARQTSRARGMHLLSWRRRSQPSLTLTWLSWTTWSIGTHTHTRDPPMQVLNIVLWVCLPLLMWMFPSLRPRWVVPVLPKGELEVLLEAAIDLSKKGRKWMDTLVLPKICYV